MRRRILAGVRPLVIVPILVVGSLALGSLLGLARTAERTLERGETTLAEDVTGRAVRSDAVAVARQVDRLLAERIDDIVTLADAPSVRSAARRAARADGNALADQPVGQLEQRYGADRRLLPGSVLDAHLRSLVHDAPEMAEIVVTERNGLTVAASGRPGDFVQRDERWWSRAWDTGLFIGEADLDRSAAGPGVTIAARIDGDARRLGVVKGVVPLEALQQTATTAAGDARVTIVTRDGLLLAESGSDHDPARMLAGGVDLDETRSRALQAALDASDPGFARDGTTVAGFASLSAVDGSVPVLSEGARTDDPGAIDLVAVVVTDDDATVAALDGLTNLEQGLWRTVWTFGVIVVLLLVAGVVAATRVSRRLADGVVGPLRSLGTGARDIAERQLPALVARARAPSGDADDLPMLQTVTVATGDEIEDVADAFNTVSVTAADLASDQARSRRNAARMFVSLGRRNQSLLGRQLELIDRLERDTSDPDLLDHLFRLDHLATRMRRNAESLLVLAGEQPARRWADPVALSDVVRGATAEIEDYRRVSLGGLDDTQLIGSAVGDVTHLLAELIENATRFSPPDTTVEVVGRRVADGYALAVVDDGVGMSAEQVKEANRRIDASAQVDQVPSATPDSASRSTARFAEPGSAKFLGLFVVGRLAARHGITVRLATSTAQGVTANVHLPTTLVDVPPQPAADVGRDAADVAPAPPPASGLPADDAAVTAEIDLRHVQAAAAAARADAAAAASHARPSNAGTVAHPPALDTRDDDATAAPPDPGDEDTAAAASDGGGDGVGEDVSVGAGRTSGIDDGEDATPKIAVTRRSSRRGRGPDETTNGSADSAHAVLRAGPSTDEPTTDATPARRPGRRPAAAMTLSGVTDEQGIALTESERVARAARDRLARFQRAVQRGRAHVQGRANGGEHRDA